MQAGDAARGIHVERFDTYDEAMAYYDRQKQYWNLPAKIKPPFIAPSEEEAPKMAPTFL